MQVHEQHLYKAETVFPGAVDGIVLGSIEHSTQTGNPSKACSYP